MPNFPVPTAAKIHPDLDGSMGFMQNSNGVYSVLSAAQVAGLTGEGTNASYFTVGANVSLSYVGFVFPESRSVASYFAVAGPSGGSRVLGRFAYSTDTTNGQDGTWTTSEATWTENQVASAGTLYRSGVHALATPITACKGVRWEVNSLQDSLTNYFFRHLHVYGAAVAGQTPDRLLFWDPTLNQALGVGAFDFGDVGRGTTTTVTFRIKNNSSTLTANSVVVSLAAITDTSPTVVSQVTFDNNGSGYAATQTITSIGPGAISAVQTVKLVLLSTATTSTWRQRLKALATTWT